MQSRPAGMKTLALIVIVLGVIALALLAALVDLARGRRPLLLQPAPAAA
jgi:hypothetical protein